MANAALQRLSFACATITLVLISVLVRSNASLVKHLLPETLVTSLSAYCLDGSPGAYYLDLATGADSNKWIFSLKLGGYCESEGDCILRSTGVQGSSKSWPEVESAAGLLSNDSAVNPDFSSWNHVFVPYCSGDLHAGTITQNSTDTFGLYFSGFNILQAILTDLDERHSLNNATDIIWSGESAGGVGAFLTVDLVESRYPNARIALLANGGWFTEEKPYIGVSKSNRILDMFPIWRGHAPPSCASCVPASNQSHCTFGNIGPTDIPTPAFWVEAVMDAYLLVFQLGFDTQASPSIDMLIWITDFYNSRVFKMQSTIFTRPNDGWWVTSAVMHVIDPSSNCSYTGVTWMQAFGNWYFSRQGPKQIFDACGSTAAISRVISYRENACSSMQTCEPQSLTPAPSFQTRSTSSCSTPVEPPSVAPTPVLSPLEIFSGAAILTSGPYLLSALIILIIYFSE